MFVPHGGLLLTQDQVGVYRKTRMLSMVLSLFSSLHPHASCHVTALISRQILSHKRDVAGHVMRHSVAAALRAHAVDVQLFGTGAALPLGDVSHAVAAFRSRDASARRRPYELMPQQVSHSHREHPHGLLFQRKAGHRPRRRLRASVLGLPLHRSVFRS